VIAVRHARGPALDRLEPLLADLRGYPQLTERTRGVFYRGSRAFLHFHEDPSGLYADVRPGEEFERLRVESAAERAELLATIDRALDPGPTPDDANDEANGGAAAGSG
jgi:hypothetical protein